MDTLVFEIYEGEGKLRMIFKRGEEVGYEVFRFDRDCFKDGIPDYAKIVSQTVADYLGQEKVAKMIYVLPDKYVFYDYVETPVIFGKSRQSMIDLELASRFSLHGAYKTAVVPVARAKGKVTSVAFMARKNHLSAIYNAMKQLRPKTSSVTFEAAMYANAFLTCDPPQRHTATMFAAVRGQRTKVAVVKEDRLLFFTDIPYGKNVCAVNRPFASTPSVLNRGVPPIDQTTTLSERGKGDNNRYLLRTLGEMHDLLEEKYQLSDLALKYSIYDDCAEDFARCAAAMGLKAKRVQSDTLVMSGKPELYAALSEKIYNVGIVL